MPGSVLNSVYSVSVLPRLVLALSGPVLGVWVTGPFRPVNQSISQSVNQEEDSAAGASPGGSFS